MTSALFCAALLSTAQQVSGTPQEAPRPQAHLALTLGFGAAHGIFGPQFEIILQHVSLSGGVGLVDVPFSEFSNDLESHVTPAFAVRAFGGDGEGLYVSLHAAFFSATRQDSNPAAREMRDRSVFGLTVGKRQMIGAHFFFDVGIGVAIQVRHRFGRLDVGPGGLVNVDETRVRPGFVWGAPTPDADLAIGIRL